MTDFLKTADVFFKHISITGKWNWADVYLHLVGHVAFGLLYDRDREAVQDCGGDYLK